MESVQHLLGEPSGTVLHGQKTILLYSGEILEFIDGKWINFLPDIQERIEVRKKASMISQEELMKKRAKEKAPFWKETVPSWKEKAQAHVGGLLSVSPQKKTTPPQEGSAVRIITYRDEQDLLSQLKQIPAGQRFDLRCSSPGYRSTGIKCGDTAGKAAYMKKQKAIIDQINAEMARINGG